MSWVITGNSYYHTAGVRKTCHDVKQNENQMLIKKIAEDLISRDIVQPGDVLIPAPQHNGNAEYTKDVANMVSEKNDKSIAAIASEESGKLYNLEVLETQINSNDQNTTRFLVFSKSEPPVPPQDSNTISIVMFTVKNIPGSLAKAVSAFGDSGYNMRSLKSHPVKNVPWQYYFYVEVEGSLMNERGTALLNSLEQVCIDVVSPGYYIEKQEA